MRFVHLFTFHYYLLLQFADVAELADALVSGSSEAIHVGSSPVVRTKQKRHSPLGVCFFVYKDGGTWNREKIAKQFVRSTKQSGGLFVG